MLKLCVLLSFLLLMMMVGHTGSHLTSGPHIADVNILLPPRMTNPVEYRLQGSDGCFKWSWDHHDILSVIPEYNSTSHCSTSARLRSIAPYTGRKETAVYAADVQTETVIRCKVFIDNFSRIQIFHSSVKLDLDGLATLRVRAFDDEENVFSSLVGLQFMWQLMPENNGLPNHLVHVPLKDSPLSDCGGLCGDLDIQIELEDSGVFSDLYVVRGIEIGHEIVSVRLLEPQFKHLSDKIILTVAEAMSLDPPSPVFVLIGAVLSYTLKVIRGNALQVVTLPSPHHRWSVSNSSVAKVDSVMGLTNALRLGVTNVIVEDTRVAGHMQVSSLNIVLPDSLWLYIVPLSVSGDFLERVKPIPTTARWYLISGHQYLIQIKVFSQGPDAQEIYITESDDVKLYDNLTDHWKIFPVSDDILVKHGSHNSRILKATSQGLGKLTASLSYFSEHHEVEVLKVFHEVMVCDQVKFSFDKRSGISQSILLPWAPGVYQEIELKASGGCGKTSSDYKWFSSDMAIVSVSASGVVQAKRPGKATIKVLSIYDSFNYDEVVIEVSLPFSMVMLHYFPVETVVGSHLQAAITMKASNGAYFYRCDAFSSFVKWKVGSESFIVVNATGKMPVLDMLGNAEFHGPPCSWTYVYASRSDRAMLHATFSKEYGHFDSSFDGPILLKASSHIAAYPPLIVQQAGDGNQFGGYWFDMDQAEADNKVENLEKLYLVPGTYLDVLLLGGPQRWDKGVEFNEKVDIVEDEHAHIKDGFHVHQLSGGYRSLYRVLCQTPGNFKIVFKRGNLVADDHPVPVIAEVSLSLTCDVPSSIVLIADEPVNEHEAIHTAIQADRASGQIRVTPITVANGRTIRIAAVGISNTGEAFANSSSLYLKWELTGCDGLAYWDDEHDLERPKYSWERFLGLQNESGQCIVRATVSGFRDAVGDHDFGQLLEHSENVLTDAIRLQLVSTLRVSPEFNLLIFNPNAKVNLSITGGSCFLEAFVNDSQVVEVVQPPTGLQCLQLILSPKGQGTALVTVYDVGLAPPLAASSVVQVLDVDWIKITSLSEVSLMEGSLHTIDLMAGVNDGSAFDASQFAYMNIQVHIEDHIVEFVDNDGISRPGGGYVSKPKFKIRATHLGITTFYVSALQQSGHEILSEPIKVEVYAPPRIFPQDIFLVPGASYVLTVKGGPTFGSYVEYATMDDVIASVHKSTGRLSAVSPGNTTIGVRIFGNGDTIICEAYGSVKVGVPSSAVLNVQSEQLGVGREMQIYPLFSEGNMFSFYELCRNYQWTVEDGKVLSFHDSQRISVEKYEAQLNASGNSQFAGYYSSEKELGFVNVLYGRSAGRTNVGVSFSCEFISSGYNSETKSYTASISISVVPELPLALGVPITWILPPHYTTTSLLPYSSESYGHLDSQSRKGTIIYSLLRNCYEKKEVMEKDVISIDKDRIKTTDSNSIACIQAKDRTTGRTEIAACVKVVEVAQIRITNEEFPFHVINLAVGAELSLPITYCDALGNPFYEAYDAAPIDVVTNYPDVVSVDYKHDSGGNIHIKALRHGRALVQISIDDIPQKSDYMLISIGPHIHPGNPVLHKGSPFNFSVEGLNDHVSGHWVTANPNVLSIDILSGTAEAIGEGTTQVYFEGSSLKLQTTVTVLGGDIVYVDSPKEMLTNVPFPKKGYSFSVKLSNTSGNKFGALGNAKGITYDCRVDPPFVGYAKPWSDRDTGNSYCLFFPYTPEHLVRSIPKSKGIKPDISVSIHASLRDANHVSGSASALFIGGFSILEFDKDSMQLNLTPESNKTVITILGNTGKQFFLFSFLSIVFMIRKSDVVDCYLLIVDVEINWNAQDLLVSSIGKKDLGVGGRAQYEALIFSILCLKVKALGMKKLKDKIVITLPASGQRAEIDVNYEPGQREASKIMINTTTFWAALLGCLALLILTLVAFICLLDRPDRSQPSFISPATPSIAAPVTPDRGSPTVSFDQSPRTPQPFMDYVRRTIDETPYYKRDARRRFNPQNTY
ncbi:hypothetical protein FEM48_ZijujUnG0099600 [Ziziphus jujuba var. spinosa]|uniref:BIG2 domain-containing protein n=1 Tax=Ziziphus jujuba var. spinosa TaxID=714518 RepID=A0A978U8A3_ZIZJJ|nr:hypothetical protein FEM48_ZijujUnG0099600 [Ziziphus jujuba var. spinosa]